MRRSEYDVADSVRTTDPTQVSTEAIRIARRLFPDAPAPALRIPAFASAEDLVMRTPRFYEGACKRLDEKLGRSYEYATRHFGGENLYLDAMRKNAEYARTVASAEDVSRRLRRRPPKTLVGH